MKRYLLHPGYVISKTDGDRHYITAKMLMKLYNVRPEECVIYLPYRPYPNQNKLINLYPMASGKYVVPPIIEIETCPKCNGTGLVQIAPNVRGLKRCPFCNGYGTGKIKTKREESNENNEDDIVPAQEEK